VIEMTKKKNTAVPMIRFTSGRSPAPTCWAIRMLAAMVAPKIAPIISIITLLALPMAVMSVAPSRCATQN
jgi:fumarate reductase subunit D